MWFRAEQVGTFYGRCYELCGKDHAFMPIAVQVVSAEDYTKWVGGPQAGDGRACRRSDEGVDAGRADGAW